MSKKRQTSAQVKMHVQRGRMAPAEYRRWLERSYVLHNSEISELNSELKFARENLFGAEQRNEWLQERNLELIGKLESRWYQPLLNFCAEFKHGFIALFR